MTVKRIAVKVRAIAVGVREPFLFITVEGAVEKVAGHGSDVHSNGTLLDRRVLGRVRPPINPVFLVKTVCIARRRPRKRILVVADVHQHAVAELFEVIHAVGLRALGLGFSQCWQQQARQNGDDRDDDQ